MEKGLDGVVDIAGNIRAIFERMLDSSIGKTETNGACLYAAILLSSALTQFAGARTIICGGGPPMDGGIFDMEGACRGHYWVEGESSTGQLFIADISSDQFGYEKVVVLTEAAGRGRYVMGDPRLIAEHVSEELEAIKTDMGGSPEG